MKKVLVQFNLPGATVKQYDQVWETLRASGNGNPKGLRHHAGGQQGDNLVVVDVWESEEAFAKFGEILMPILAKVGIPLLPPVILPVHYEYPA